MSRKHNQFDDDFELDKELQKEIEEYEEEMEMNEATFNWDNIKENLTKQAKPLNITNLTDDMYKKREQNARIYVLFLMKKFDYNIERVAKVCGVSVSIIEKYLQDS